MRFLRRGVTSVVADTIHCHSAAAAAVCGISELATGPLTAVQCSLADHAAAAVHKAASTLVNCGTSVSPSVTVGVVPFTSDKYTTLECVCVRMFAPE